MYERGARPPCPFGTNNEMQMRAHVGEIIDADIEPTSHPAEEGTHDAIVPA
jgi:hypothetical protein